MTSIASLLEEHPASISADCKTAFAALKEKLNKTQATFTEHNQRIDSLEPAANLQERRIQTLEEQCAARADSNAQLTAKTADLEVRSRRNNKGCESE